MRNALTTKQSFWQGYIKGAQDEGIALAQYAKHNGLNVKTLYNWRSILTNAFGKALNYCYKLKDKLRFYCEDGNLPISNQVAENAIRPFAISRENFLFYDTPKGATASANLYSLIMTAKSNGLDPFYYLAFVFKHLPIATTLNDIERLLPWNVDTIEMKNAFAFVNRGVY